MTQVPTNRTVASSIAEHTSDHNIFAAQHNELDGHAADTAAHDLDATIAAAIDALVAAAPGTLDTLNELAAALGDDADFAATITAALAGKSATSHDHDADYEATGATATHSADTTSVHGIADTADLETTTGSAAKVAAHESDTSVHGIADTSVLATDAEVATAVSNHSADTTAVHGIADTSALALTSHDHSGTYELVGVAATADSAHVAAANPHTVYALDTDLATHEADTTSIHGIADTSVLATDAEVATAVSDHEAAANPHPTYETSAEAAAKITAHEALADPHPDYTTTAELATHAATTHGGAAEVTTHEAAADPHTGYLKESVISGLATPAIVLGSSAAAGSTLTPIRSDATIAAFDATNPTTQAFGDAAAVGTAAFAARRDHKHAMPANPVTAHEAAGDPHTGYTLESQITASGKGFVNHGATAGTARPSGYASVEWFGSVEPTNAVNGDSWVSTA